MCGLCFASFSNDSTVNIREVARILLREMQKRGDQATGVACFTPDGIIATNRPIPARDYVQSKAFRRGLADDARVFIGHTRLATQGDRRNLLNNHPVFAYSLEGDQIAAVHNGMIYNDTECFRDYSLPRFAEVDSEIIPAMIAKYGSDDYASIFNVLEGGIATAWLDERTPGVLHCVRASSSPMVVVCLSDVALPGGGTITGVVGASTENALDLVLDFLGVDYFAEGVAYWSIPEGSRFTVTNGRWDGTEGEVTMFDLPDMHLYGRGWSSYMTSRTGGGTTYKGTSTPSSSVTSSTSRKSDNADSYAETLAAYDDMDWSYPSDLGRAWYDPATGTSTYGDPNVPLALDDSLCDDEGLRSGTRSVRTEADEHYAANLAVQLDLLAERMEDNDYVLSADDRALIADSVEYGDLLGSVGKRLGLPAEPSVKATRIVSSSGGSSEIVETVKVGGVWVPRGSQYAPESTVLGYPQGGGKVLKAAQSSTPTAGIPAKQPTMISPSPALSPAEVPEVPATVAADLSKSLVQRMDERRQSRGASSLYGRDVETLVSSGTGWV